MIPTLRLPIRIPRLAGPATLLALALLASADRPALAQQQPVQARQDAQARQAEEEAVLSVVQRLFDAMRVADSAAVRAVFHPDAVLIGTEDPQGEASVSIRPIARFVRAVGGATGEWDERWWEWRVRIDQNLASVWTEYAFYLDGEFSHCGVDAFLLGRDGTEWRIVSLADTRRREGCEDPPADAR